MIGKGNVLRHLGFVRVNNEDGLGVVGGYGFGEGSNKDRDKITATLDDFSGSADVRIREPCHLGFYAHIKRRLKQQGR